LDADLSGIGTNHILVDLAIAIVIFAIADLRRGLTGCGITLRTRAISFADVFTGASTFSYSNSTFLTQIGEISVDLAIAIVVFAIADLG
jgi:hypothetical protein